MKPITEIQARLRKRLIHHDVFRKHGRIVPIMPTIPGLCQQVVSNPLPELSRDVEFLAGKGCDAASRLINDFDLI